MQINGIDIEDTFAEAFPMTATRLIITAADRYWALRAAESAAAWPLSLPIATAPPLGNFSPRDGAGLCG